MKINYKAFNHLIKTPLMDIESFESFLNNRLCEVDGIEGDVLDVKILPDRAADTLSYYGLAREFAAYTNVPLANPLEKFSNEASYHAGDVNVVSDASLCGCMVAISATAPEHIHDAPFLDEVLVASGQKRINPLVDITNYMMFMYGNPVHVYDAKKMNHTMIVRGAVSSEIMETLHGEPVVFSGDEIVITNGEAIVSLAGVKGGVAAEIDAHTKDVVFEMAIFNKSKIRGMTSKLRISTEASKRFVHPLPAPLPLYITPLFVEVLEKAGFTNLKVNTWYEKNGVDEPIQVSWKKIDSLLGMNISPEHAVSVLQTVGFQVEVIDADTAQITPPWWRTDVDCYEVIADEIGRFSGYDTVRGQLCDFVNTIEIGNYASRIQLKQKIASLGFSEIITYSFVKKGEVEVAYPIAKDKGALRSNLFGGFSEAMLRNKSVKDVCSIDVLSCFEIGTIFTKEGEFEHVIVASESKASCDNMKSVLANDFSGAMFEMIQEKSSDGLNYVEFRITYNAGDKVMEIISLGTLKGMFKQWSLYPAITRDISMWESEGLPEGKATEVIKDYMTELCVAGPRLVDSFEKNGKIARLYRLVFQSHDRTLENSEIEVIMNVITGKLGEAGFDVR